MGGLSVEELVVARAGRRVIDGVGFTLAPGEVLAVVGANGSGKTTLLDGVLGFLPAAGRVSWQGKALRTLADRARVFSCMPDDAEPPSEVSVATLMAHAQRFAGGSDGGARELAEQLNLQRLRGARAGELSRGERKRLLLFSALCTHRPVVVLDEPLGTFDPLQLISVIRLLHQRAASGTALILSVHQMSDAEKLASRVLMLHGGNVLAQGTLAELRAQVGVEPLEEIFLELLRRAHA